MCLTYKHVENVENVLNVVHVIRQINSLCNGYDCLIRIAQLFGIRGWIMHQLRNFERRDIGAFDFDTVHGHTTMHKRRVGQNTCMLVKLFVCVFDTTFPSPLFIPKPVDIPRIGVCPRPIARKFHKFFVFFVLFEIFFIWLSCGFIIKYFFLLWFQPERICL